MIIPPLLPDYSILFTCNSLNKKEGGKEETLFLLYQKLHDCILAMKQVFLCLINPAFL